MDGWKIYGQYYEDMHLEPIPLKTLRVFSVNIKLSVPSYKMDGVKAYKKINQINPSTIATFPI